MQLAAVAALCVQYEAEFRPNMSIVVKALQPLLQVPAPAALLQKCNVKNNKTELTFSECLIVSAALRS